MNNTVNVHMPDQMKTMSLHVTVTGAKRTSIRIMLGAFIVKLAGIVMGCDLTVETDVDRCEAIDREAARIASLRPAPPSARTTAEG